MKAFPWILSAVLLMILFGVTQEGCNRDREKDALQHHYDSLASEHALVVGLVAKERIRADSADARASRKITDTIIVYEKVKSKLAENSALSDTASVLFFHEWAGQR